MSDPDEARDADIERVLRSNLPDDVKQLIVAKLIAAKKEHEERVRVWVEELIVEAEEHLRRNS